MLVLLFLCIYDVKSMFSIFKRSSESPASPFIINNPHNKDVSLWVCSFLWRQVSIFLLIYVKNWEILCSLAVSPSLQVWAPFWRPSKPRLPVWNRFQPLRPVRGLWRWRQTRMCCRGSVLVFRRRLCTHSWGDSQYCCLLGQNLGHGPVLWGCHIVMVLSSSHAQGVAGQPWKDGDCVILLMWGA